MLDGLKLTIGNITLIWNNILIEIVYYLGYYSIVE